MTSPFMGFLNIPQSMAVSMRQTDNNYAEVEKEQQELH